MNRYGKIIVGCLLLASSIYADEYKNVAENFLKYKGISKSIVNTIELKSVSGDIVGYVYSLDEVGYIIVPATKIVSPIKSYSFDGKFENMHPNFKKFLIEELTGYKAQSGLKKVLDDTIQKRWELLENYNGHSSIKLNKDTPLPLLNTTWNQPYPYNKALPKIGDTNVLTGCVQTADAQVMQYHKWPSMGQEYAFNKQSTNSVTDLSAVFHRYYNWDIMPSSLVGAKEYEIDEVAYLMKDLVVANQAMFEGTSGTGAYPNPEPLVRYFKYSSDIKMMDNQNTSNSLFFDTIKDQYSKKLPVLFSVPGHRVVVDGYDDDLVGAFAHINMGWGGSANAYYNLENTITAGSYAFAPNYSMFYDVMPCSSEAGNCYKNLENSSEMFLGSNIDGVFNSLNDVDNYKVKLKGSIKISGSRTGITPSNNMYFYVGIFDENGQLIHNITKTTTLTFTEANYEIRTSLSSFENGSYWQMQGGENGYNVKLEDVYLSTISSAEDVEYPPIIDQDIGTQVISGEHKIVIYGYDKNDDDTLQFEAISNNGNVQVDMNQSLLTITPKVTKGHSKVKVILTSGEQSVEKEFDVIINNSDILFGKNFTIDGMFESQEDYNEHTVILDGQCTIKGQTTGYSNQAFYTKLVDKFTMALSNMSNQSITTSDLDLETYTIGASLMQNPGGYGGYYTYGDNTKNYKLFVSCPNADDSIETISNILGIVVDNSDYNVDTNSLPAVTLASSLETQYNTSKTISYEVSDVDGDNVTVTISTNGSNGTATIDQTAKTITYTPNNDFYGSDNFVVSFDDGNGKLVNKTVLVTVNEPVNIAPSVSVETSHSVIEDESVQFPYSTYDQNGDSVTSSVFSEPTNGSVLIENNYITYTPSQGFSGSDSFVLLFSDSKKNGDVKKTISITVLEKANSIPVVDINNSVVTNQNENVSISYSVSDADSDTILVTIKQAPSYGSAVLDDGAIIYVPNESFYGNDMFIASFDDGKGGLVEEIINISVNPVIVNKQPIVEIPSLVVTDENISTTMIYSVYDEDGDSVAVDIESNATNGVVVVNEQNNTISYTPNSGFVGSDSFDLSFKDNQTQEVVKTVDIVVNKNNNNIPVVMRLVNYHEIDQDTNTTLAPNPVVIDSDDDNVSVTVQTEPSYGSVSISDGPNEGEKIIVYNPNIGYFGDDNFKLLFDDQNGGKVIEEMVVKVTQGITSYINIKTGWNLVSLPVDINITDQNITQEFTKLNTLWKYNNNGWEAFGGTLSLKESLTNAGITQLSSIQKGEGFWVNNYLDQSLAFKGDEYDISYENILKNAPSGWSLLGTGKDISVTQILAVQPTLNTIWVYEDGWKAYSPLENMKQSLQSAGIEALSTVKKGQGFWINVK